MQTKFNLKQLKWLKKGAERERKLREKVFPGLVRKGKMTEAKAHAETVWIEKIEELLNELIENEHEQHADFFKH